MPTAAEINGWYGMGGRQPYHYSDGTHLTTKEPSERRNRRASKSLDRRRGSLHRGYHSEHENRHQDPWEPESEEENPALAHQLGRPRQRSKKRPIVLAPEPPIKDSVVSLAPDSSDFSDEDWEDTDQYDERYGRPDDQFPYSALGHGQHSDEDASSDQASIRLTSESRPQRPSEHGFYGGQLSAAYSSRRRPHLHHSYSDGENMYRGSQESWAVDPSEHDAQIPSRGLGYKPGEYARYHRAASLRRASARSPGLPYPTSHDQENTVSLPVPPGEPPQYAKKTSARRKASRRALAKASAFSDTERYGSKKNVFNNGPYQPGENVFSVEEERYLKKALGELPEDRVFRRRKSAASLSRKQRRASTSSKTYQTSPERPVSARRIAYPGLDDKTEPGFSDPISKSLDNPSISIHASNYVSDSTVRQENQSARPAVPRTISESLPMRLKALFIGDPKIEEELKPTTQTQTWDPSASVKSAVGTSHTSGSLSSASGILGPKVYVYKPLQHKMDFRLVKVLPERTAKLKCEILHASLERPPEYTAISYCWGDGVDQKRLVLSGAVISVNTSLHGALKAVRDKEKDVFVWVDALSIDQANKAERASQVQLMGHIYSRAKLVAIWLGPHADDSELAIPLLEDVAKGTLSKKRIRSVGNPDASALRTLFKREYWNRMWVVQEVFLAREKWVYCGNSQLPWKAYETASNAFWEHQTDPHLRQGPSSFPNMSSLVGLGANSLLEVLRACRKKLSENPRDKVYGVLGMLPDATRKELPVDYDQSVKSLYLDVADHIISSTRRLDVIREAIHFPLHSSSADLPSWCPEWSHIPEISALREPNFAAAADTKADFEFHDNERKLEFAAIELGTINATGVAVGTFCSLQDYLMAFLNWRALLMNMTNLNEHDENNPLLEAFCQTLALGQIPPEWEQDGWRAPCYQVFSTLIQKRLPRLPIDLELQQYSDFAYIHPDEVRAFAQTHFGERMMGRTFCITENGLMGMGSGFMRKGDVVVVPFGCSTPILLRGEGRRGEFRYVGDVYIHGFMHGEALADSGAVKKYMLH